MGTESLEQGARQVASILTQAGYQAFFAGGCVRDQLLGLTPKDYDIATNARPEEVSRLFKRTLQVGASFGVVKVLWTQKRDYEVATFRKDGTYTDGRRPDGVEYSDTPEEDVARRDFTVNALLFDPNTDTVFDYVGGQADLSKGVIRAVGDPHQRFAEDRLRMLRAVRFAARFGFDIEPATEAAIREHAAGLKDVSVERIVQELHGIFRSARPALGVDRVFELGLGSAVVPFVEVNEAVRDRLKARFSRLGSATADLSVEARDAVGWALLVDACPPRALEAHLKQRKLSREQIRNILALVRAKDDLARVDETRPAWLIRQLVGAHRAELAAYQRALLSDEAPPVHAFAAAHRELMDHPLPKLPLVTGQDLMGLGLKPGPTFKVLLSQLEVEIFERRITTKEGALQWIRSQSSS